MGKREKTPPPLRPPLKEKKETNTPRISGGKKKMVGEKRPGDHPDRKKSGGTPPYVSTLRAFRVKKFEKIKATQRGSPLERQGGKTGPS